MMRRYFNLLMILLLVLPLSLAESPSNIKITSFVNDYGNIFSDVEEATLSNLLKNIYDSNTAEFSIVTIKSLDGYDSQGFAQEISEGNLGDSEKNNGLLLLIAVEDRQYWFNVGRGLEPIFNDAKIGRIGRESIVPYFKEGLYFDGCISATNQIAKELEVELTNNVTPSPISQTSINPTLVFVMMFFILSIFRTIAARNQVKDGKKRKNNSNLFLAAIFASSMMRGGRGGSGGFGGGFGGFGGGGFGGGGAGGGW